MKKRRRNAQPTAAVNIPVLPTSCPVPYCLAVAVAARMCPSRATVLESAPPCAQRAVPISEPAIPTVTQAPPCFAQSRVVEPSSPPSPSQLSRTRPSLPWTRAQPVFSSAIIQAQTRVLT
ncbi:hypothetical protein M0R45_007120 [Rubus argutus]|uniref:Uncharacterized protein n=1 Tax=Rubus argutus TaxID=59490 RepID=A0AAW1YSN2_RUBAR